MDHTIKDVQQCSGTTKSKERCKKRTTTDHKCWIHASKEDGVRVKKSNIPQAGKGLFAEKDFKKEEKVTDYCGERLTKQQLDQRYDEDETAQYAVQMGNNYFIDARKSTDCFGRYINSPLRTKFKGNVRFATRPGQSGKVSIKATRNIKKGSELYLPYGRAYRL